MNPVVGGPFLIGSDPQYDHHARVDEQPQRSVDVKAFAIGRYPVTVAEYQCFVNRRNMRPQDWFKQRERLDHPVTGISQSQALDYAAWLATLTGEQWRLPSSDEWEAAARGTDGRIYPWGDMFDSARCNTKESAPRRTTYVGTYTSGFSPCHALDMAGNVWEWTTKRDDSMTTVDSLDDEPQPVTSLLKYAMRGGSWASRALQVRAAYRRFEVYDHRSNTVGFRLAMDIRSYP